MKFNWKRAALWAITVGASVLVGCGGGGSGTDNGREFSSGAALSQVSPISAAMMEAGAATALPATPEVKAKVDALLTSFVPNVTETKIVASTQSFTHPGIGVSKALLDDMRAHVRASEEPWASAFLQLSVAGASKTAPTMRIFTDTARNYVDIPGGGLGSDGYYIVRNMAQDAHTALAQTLMWYITGKEIHRTNAMNLLRQWSKVQSIGNIYDEQIRVSLAIYQFTYAAEILKSTTAGTAANNWSAADETGFLSLLSVMKSKYDRYTHFMNQHGICVMATLASAIYRNNAADYAIAVQRATTNPELGMDYDFSLATNPHNRDGSIFSQIRAVTKDVLTGAAVPVNIQLVEMGRDQGHPYVSIGALSAIAMTTYLQGTKVDPTLGTISAAENRVNLFQFASDRLLFGANYLTQYNLGNAVTYVPTYNSATGAIYTEPTTADRGEIQPTLGILYNYYRYVENRADMDTNPGTKYLSQAFAKIYPEGDSQDFVGHSVLLYTSLKP